MNKWLIIIFSACLSLVLSTLIYDIYQYQTDPLDKAQVSVPFEVYNRAPRVTALSISSDGRYVISVHGGHYLVLWDIQNQTNYNSTCKLL